MVTIDFQQDGCYLLVGVQAVGNIRVFSISPLLIANQSERLDGRVRQMITGWNVQIFERDYFRLA
jgi:hypothetical protein